MIHLSSIKIKFTLWYLGVLSLILICLGTGIYAGMAQQLRKSLDDALSTRAGQLSDLRDIIAIVTGGTFEQVPGEIVSFFYNSEKGLEQLALRRQTIPADEQWIERVLAGEKLYTTLGVEPPLRVFALSFIPRQTRKEGARTKSPPRYMTENRPPPPRPGEERRGRRHHTHPPPPDRPRHPESFTRNLDIPKAVLVVARPLDGVERTLAMLSGILLGALPLTILLSGWGGLFLMRRILKPVERMTDTAKIIQETDLGRRIPVDTRDELGTLAHTLNRMIDRLEKAFKRQKELTGDVSHELRAPLAVIQAEATLALRKRRNPTAYEKTLQIIIAETERMTGMIRQILFLARADADKHTTAFSDLNFSALIQELCRDVDILCREKGIHLSGEIAADLRVKGDTNALKQMVMNLLSNAIRYTQKGGKIKVKAAWKSPDVVFSVHDSGIGIPEKDLPRIFDRFYRVEKARSRHAGGSGLGLAITREIVKMHHGKIQVASHEGKGSIFRVRLKGYMVDRHRKPELMRRQHKSNTA